LFKLTLIFACHGGQMATDTTRLQGEIVENPEKKMLNIEQLLKSFLQSLIFEHKNKETPTSRNKKEQ